MHSESVTKPSSYAKQAERPDVLSENLRRFATAVPWGDDALKALYKEDFRPTRAWPIGDHRYFLLQAEIPRRFQEGFGMAPELLFVLVADKVQAKDLDRARSEVARSKARIDTDLLIVADNTPDLSARLDRLPDRWARFIPWPVETSNAGVSLPRLGDQLRKHLPRFDLFDERKPVRGRFVIGRTDDISELVTRIEQGHSVGVFGLRKVGKTTIVRAVTDQLDPIQVVDPLPVEGRSEPRALVVWLDIQALSHVKADTLARTLVVELRKRLREARVSLPEERDAGDPIPELARHLEAALQEQSQPLCLVLDEYDYLFEGLDDKQQEAKLARLLRVIRGHAQQTDRLSLVVIGRDPTFLQAPRIGSATNPMLGWLVSRWVGPLAPAHADELLVRLGKRVGLAIGPESQQVARHWTAGHPLLHRMFGSALLSERRKQKTMLEEESVPTDPWITAATQAFCERDAVLEICREVFDLLHTRYPPAYDLLMELARETPQDGGTVLEMFAGWSGPTAAVLRNFGLVSGSETMPMLPEVLRWYVRTYKP